MARINWDAPGERRYESGVSRGVLYPDGGGGVAWNGIASVDESTDSSAPEPIYFNGVKIRESLLSEEFKFTISAYSSPAEFAPCEGRVSVGFGIYVTQQVRESFGFSYRTEVFTDIQGQSHYKLHLVYGCVATPSNISNRTLSAAPDPELLSWEVKTVPNVSPADLWKPTAHVIVDSSEVGAGYMKYLEDILYGVTAKAPRLPNIEEVVNGYTTGAPVYSTNLVPNPTYNPAGLLDWHEGRHGWVTHTNEGTTEDTRTLVSVMQASDTSSNMTAGLNLWGNPDTDAPPTNPGSRSVYLDAGIEYLFFAETGVSGSLSGKYSAVYWRLHDGQGNWVNGIQKAVFGHQFSTYYTKQAIMLAPTSGYLALSVAVDTRGYNHVDGDYLPGYFIRKLMVRDSRHTRAPKFFYGGSPDTVNSVYDWVGAPYNSPSTVRMWS